VAEQGRLSLGAQQRYKSPYLDSNVFIAWKKGEVVAGVDRFGIAQHILLEAEEGHAYRITISALTLAEVYKVKGRPERLSNKLTEELLLYFQNDWFDVIPVDRSIGEEANLFCRQYGILPNDAIHLACALRASCDVLLAWDKRFCKVNHPSIRLEEPQIIPVVFRKP
jgi:predicted nucleic acid-binding protein